MLYSRVSVLIQEFKGHYNCIIYLLKLLFFYSEEQTTKSEIVYGLYFIQLTYLPKTFAISMKSKHTADTR